MNIVAVLVILAVVAIVGSFVNDFATIQRLAVLIFAIAALRQLLRR